MSRAYNRAVLPRGEQLIFPGMDALCGENESFGSDQESGIPDPWPSLSWRRSGALVIRTWLWRKGRGACVGDKGTTLTRRGWGTRKGEAEKQIPRPPGLGMTAGENTREKPQVSQHRPLGRPELHSPRCRCRQDAGATQKRKAKRIPPLQGKGRAPAKARAKSRSLGLRASG